MNPTHPWLEHLVDQPDAAVMIVGSGSAISYATPAAERMLGTTSGALAGMTMDQLLPVERRGELKNFEDVLAGGSGRRLRSALRLPDGRRIDVSLTLSPLLDEQGRVQAVSASYEPARSSAQWVRASLTPARPPQAVSFPRESLTPPPASRNSEQRLTPARMHSNAPELLSQLERQLRWLEDRLSSPPALAPLDDPRERARALLMVAEARDLAEKCKHAIQNDAHNAAQAIPAPPKLPRM